MSTNTNMPTPACENCGRDKSPTYICDTCIDKLNAVTRAITAERDEWKRRLDAVLTIDPDRLDLLAKMFDTALPGDTNPEIQTTLRNWADVIRIAIAEGKS